MWSIVMKVLGWKKMSDMKMKVDPASGVERGDWIDLYLLNTKSGRMKKRVFKVNTTNSDGELGLVEVSWLNRIWYWIWYTCRNLLN